MPRVRNICKECGTYKPHSSSPKCIPCRFRFSIDVNGCWVWAGYCDPKGYGEFSLYAAENSAHRVSWIIHNGPIPFGLHVLHSCDNPPCVNPDHLFLGTHQQNMEDKVRKGRAFVKGPGLAASRGEGHSQARLKAEDVRAIRASCQSSRELASIYGVHVTHINRIKRGAKWSHLKTDPGCAGALAGSYRQPEPIAKVRRAL